MAPDIEVDLFDSYLLWFVRKSLIGFRDMERLSVSALGKVECFLWRPFILRMAIGLRQSSTQTWFADRREGGYFDAEICQVASMFGLASDRSCSFFPSRIKRSQKRVRRSSKRLLLLTLPSCRCDRSWEVRHVPVRYNWPALEFFSPVERWIDAVNKEQQLAYSGRRFLWTRTHRPWDDSGPDDACPWLLNNWMHATFTIGHYKI